MKKILVIGSINIDLVAKVASFPQPGETVSGQDFSVFPGGKGANQAVAAGKLGADIMMLGKVGDDNFGEIALDAMTAAGVDVSGVEKMRGCHTGVALINVSSQGENAIVCVPGANEHVNVHYLQNHLDIIDSAEIILMQLEIPYETVEWAAAYAHAKGKKVIFDPAPARRLSDKLLSSCFLLTPNETEMRIVLGVSAAGKEPNPAAMSLFEKGVAIIVNKCGKNGAFMIERSRKKLIPGFSVEPVDTTAAGDTFNAGLAYSLSKGETVESAIRYANAAAAISVTKYGAQSAMPGSEQVRTFLKNFRER